MAFEAFDLSGKVALVTGGNSGIGLGMADGLARAGADVCVWGTNAAKNADARTRLEAHGTKVLALQCDVGSESEVEACFAETLSSLGRVDACFANAGIGGAAPSFMEMSSDEWRRVLRVNLDGVFFTFRAASRHMVERGGGGSLVVTSSLSATEGFPMRQHYATSKAGVIAMARGLAVELARHAIRANAIVPGWIDTPMTSDSLTHPKFLEKVLKRVPMRRWGEGEDFAGLAVYLASDASRYHTGDTLVVDGAYGIF